MKPDSPRNLEGRPTTVEVGQIWRTQIGLDDPAFNWVARRVEDGLVLFTRPDVPANPKQTPLTDVDDVLSEYTFVGWEPGFGSPTATPAPVGERDDGFPVSCLMCGGKKRDGQVYVCDRCVETSPAWFPLSDAWDAGARDFPRPAVTVPPVGPSAGLTPSAALPRFLAPALTPDDVADAAKYAVPGIFRYGAFAPKPLFYGIDLGREASPPPPLTARQILDGKARARELKRLEDQQAVCAMVDFVDTLRDA